MENRHHHISRRMFILGQTMLSASALAPSTAYAKRRDSSPAKEASNWLQEDLVPIRSLDPADEAYDDLEPLARAIGPARLVLLGESSHGAGSDFKAKVRLIKFLCQRMDFDVIVWESGFHAMDQVNAALRAMGDPVAAAKDGDDSWATAPKPTPIPPAPPDSLEARLHSTGRPFVFVNLRGRKSWGENISTQRIFVPSPGDSSTKSNGIFSVAKTPNLFDGIFFIDRMTPATPIGSR